MKPSRRRKPRPTYVLEPLIKQTQADIRTCLKKYTANEYFLKRHLELKLMSLESELYEAKAMYLKKENPQ